MEGEECGIEGGSERLHMKVTELKQRNYNEVHAAATLINVSGLPNSCNTVGIIWKAAGGRDGMGWGGMSRVGDVLMLILMRFLYSIFSSDSESAL